MVSQMLKKNAGNYLVLGDLFILSILWTGVVLRFQHSEPSHQVKVKINNILHELKS